MKTYKIVLAQLIIVFILAFLFTSCGSSRHLGCPATNHQGMHMSGY